MALVFALTAAVGAQSLDPPQGLAGLVTPNQVAAGPPDCFRVDLIQKLELRAAPQESAPSLGWLAFVPWRPASGECDAVTPMFETPGHPTGQAIPAFESGYEELALAVLERRGEWLRIDLGTASGWLLRPPGYRFDPYPELLVDRLAYATPDWTGELCASPGRDCRRPEADPNQALNVVSVAVRNDEAWLEVELTSATCGAEDPVIRHRGFIRASVTGRPTAWFYSRGC